MGDRFDNSGALALSVGYASTSGRTAATVQIVEGVPGSNGSTDILASTGSATVTPSTGSHFYYAKVTKDDGMILWSAPVWVNQGMAGAPDATPPTVSASESGTSGTITLSATASDNVGVSRVDFLVDSALKGCSSATPYAISLDSTTLSNANHSLIAKAYGVAGNVGTSTVYAFSVINAGGSMNESEPNRSIAAANVVGLNTIITGKTYKNGVSAKTAYIEVVSCSGSSTTLRYTLRLSHL